MAVKRVWASRPFQYQNLFLDRGQVFELRNARNDDRLLNFGYVKPVEKESTLFECGVCGGEFVGESERQAHGKKRHPARPLTEEEEDRLLDREERRMAELAPVGPPEPVAV